jgi:hypothetical protein
MKKSLYNIFTWFCYVRTISSLAVRLQPLYRVTFAVIMAAILMCRGAVFNSKQCRHLIFICFYCCSLVHHPQWVTFYSVACRQQRVSVEQQFIQPMAHEYQRPLLRSSLISIAWHSYLHVDLRLRRHRQNICKNSYFVMNIHMYTRRSVNSWSVPQYCFELLTLCSTVFL